MPNSTFPFSLRALAALKPNGRQQWFTDRRQRGLQLAVLPSGKKVWYFRRKVNGKSSRQRVGTFPTIGLEDARRIAQQHLRQAELGEFKPADRTTFAEAFEQWLVDAKKRGKKTWSEDVRKFNTYLVPLHGVRLRDLTSADIKELHAQWGERHGIYAANRAFSLARAVINWAIREDDIAFDGRNPCQRVKPFRELPRERYLTPAELRRFFHALAEARPVARDALLLLLFSGARKSNVHRMRWRDVDLDFKIWRIPETKSGLSVVVPLAAPAINILRRRRETAINQWVFPSPIRPWRPVTDLRKSWQRVLEHADLEDVRIHDLRRTLGSWQAMAGASSIVIGKSLGHAPGSTATAIYARLSDAAVRESIESTVARMLEHAEGHVDE